MALTRVPLPVVCPLPRFGSSEFPDPEKDRAEAIGRFLLTHGMYETRTDSDLEKNPTHLRGTIIVVKCSLLGKRIGKTVRFPSGVDLPL